MRKNKDYKNALKNLSLISQVGLSIVTPILLGVFIGQFLDNKLGTKGIFMLIFIILGAGGGFLNLLKITGAWQNKRK